MIFSKQELSELVLGRWRDFLVHETESFSKPMYLMGIQMEFSAEFSSFSLKPFICPLNFLSPYFNSTKVCVVKLWVRRNSLKKTNESMYREMRLIFPLVNQVSCIRVAEKLSIYLFDFCIDITNSAGKLCSDYLKKLTHL